MKRAMILISVLSAIVSIGFAFGYHLTHFSVLESIAITALTVVCHLSLRFIIGAIIGKVGRKRINSSRRWFVVKSWEKTLYDKLQVKKWKKHIPTYAPGEFSLESHTLQEIIHNTCVSELVHETIVLFSFLPILLSIPFGAFPVFLITSVLAACFDCIFVVLQRYNRPRLINLINKQTKRSS